MGFWPAAAAAIASILTGGAVVVTRIIVEEIPPLPLAWLRFGVAVLFLLTPVVIFRRYRVSVKTISVCLGLGALFFGVFTYCFNVALETTPAARAGTLVAVMPIITLLLAASIRIEKITAVKLLGIVVTLGGVAVVLGFPGSAGAPAVTLHPGDIWLLGAACCGAIYNVGARLWLSQVPTLSSAFWSMCGGVMLLSAVIFAADAWPTPGAISFAGVASLAYLGIAAGAVGFSLWIWALSRATPTHVAVFFSLNPVSAALLANWALGEALRADVVVGVAAVVAGIVITTLSPDRTKASTRSLPD